MRKRVFEFAHAEHAMTRTFAARGIATAKAEAGMAFRTVLARDIQDVRGIVGSKYNPYRACYAFRSHLANQGQA